MSTNTIPDREVFETIVKLKALLPKWHFEPYGTTGKVACFPPNGEMPCCKHWDALQWQARISDVCGCFYTVRKVRHREMCPYCRCLDELENGMCGDCQRYVRERSRRADEIPSFQYGGDYPDL